MKAEKNADDCLWRRVDPCPERKGDDMAQWYSEKPLNSSHRRNVHDKKIDDAWEILHHLVWGRESIRFLGRYRLPPADRYIYAGGDL